MNHENANLHMHGHPTVKRCIERCAPAGTGGAGFATDFTLCICDSGKGKVKKR
jgi:hypothetical protein